MFLFILFSFFSCCTAFGAGNIPSYAFLEGKAYRHGDIEDILADMFIRVAASEGGGVFDFFNRNVGEKFSGLDVKRTYFGNWLYPILPHLTKLVATFLRRSMLAPSPKVLTFPPSVSSSGFSVSCPSVMRPTNSKSP